MREVRIEQVAIDAAGRLLVRPAISPGEDYAFIYRAAMGVQWDPETRSLAAPLPRERSYAWWFGRIVAAVSSEYGQRLALDEATRWSNVPPGVRGEIEVSGAGGPNGNGRDEPRRGS